MTFNNDLNVGFFSAYAIIPHDQGCAHDQLQIQQRLSLHLGPQETSTKIAKQLL